jgi:hypothetical protein
MMYSKDVQEWLQKGARSGHVDEADQAMLDQRRHVLMNFKPHTALPDTSKSLPDRHDTTARTEHVDRGDGAGRSAATSHRQGPSGRRHSDFTGTPPAPLRQGRRPSMPMLEFQVQTVPEPDLDWLNDTEDFEEAGAARVFRKTPMPERAPPRESETFQRLSPNCTQLPQAAEVRPFEQKAEQHGGRTWKEFTAALTRLLQSASRAEALVWRRGDDA